MSKIHKHTLKCVNVLECLCGVYQRWMSQKSDDGLQGVPLLEALLSSASARQQVSKCDSQAVPHTVLTDSAMMYIVWSEKGLPTCVCPQWGKAFQIPTFECLVGNLRNWKATEVIPLAFQSHGNVFWFFFLCSWENHSRDKQCLCCWRLL